ncbi:arylsulfatase [Nonomuraea sp. NPDC051941]|uniref:arylsulfatase n=1 Tax=Nonomuraea sp. NPDC051941 TaxID=3364373 RepID=UPI0037C4F2F2
MPAPNVIVILADDLGYSDLGSFGGEIDTPNLDRLARSGVRMTSFYVTPRCSPSRAALLTGRHPHSVGIGVLTRDNRPAGYRGSLDQSVPTLAQRLKGLGYRTGLVGKWHLSSDTTTPNDTWPTRRGFDEFYGILPGCSSYYQPPLMSGESRVPEAHADPDYYITDDLSEHARDFVARASAGDTPFFLYLAYTAPHWPLHAREADIAKYRERYRAGWDTLRAERFRRQADLGVAGVAELPPRDEAVPPWADVDDHAWQVERMATYAAQVEVMDRGIGQVLDQLERSGTRENTIVMFLSDNGGCAEELPHRPGQPFLGEEICPRHTRLGEPVEVGNTPRIMPGPEQGYVSYGRGWANLSNTPFRLYKRWVHEGGVASPFIVSWPSDLPADRVERRPGHLVDLTSTIVEAADGHADTAGHSLLPVWRGDDLPAADEPRTLCWEHIGNAAVRRGRWKLVREWGGPWELYDIEADRGESEDLAPREPSLVAELAAVWEQWAKDNAVIPWSDVLADLRRRGRPETEALR